VSVFELPGTLARSPLHRTVPTRVIASRRVVSCCAVARVSEEKGEPKRLFLRDCLTRGPKAGTMPARWLQCRAIARRLVSPILTGPAEGSTMDGREEKRNRKTFLVMLSSTTQPLAMALASTENVSSRGMRVQTDRPWKPDTRLLVETSQGERSARARVVYCETLSDTTFAVGLELLAHTDACVSGA
jgi:PilZ domain-containing protein